MLHCQHLANSCMSEERSLVYSLHISWLATTRSAAVLLWQVHGKSCSCQICTLRVSKSAVNWTCATQDNAPCTLHWSRPCQAGSWASSGYAAHHVTGTGSSLDLGLASTACVHVTYQLELVTTLYICWMTQQRWTARPVQHFMCPLSEPFFWASTTQHVGQTPACLHVWRPHGNKICQKIVSVVASGLSSNKLKACNYAWQRVSSCYIQLPTYMWLAAASYPDLCSKQDKLWFCDTSHASCRQHHCREACLVR